MKTNSWDRRCAGCHSNALTNIEINTQGEFMATYIEQGVGCEDCHGPASLHIATRTLDEEGEGALSPDENGDEEDLHIINPEKLDYQYAVETCGRCHTRGSSALALNGSRLGYPRKLANQEFRPGRDTLADTYVEVNPVDDAKRFWPIAHTGEPVSKSHHQQFIDFKSSDKYLGDHPVNCFDCHNPHIATEHQITQVIHKSGLDIETENDNNTLCLACHAGHGPFATLTREMIADYDANKDSIA